MSKLNYYKKTNSIKNTIDKRFNIFIVILIIVTSIFFVRLFNIQIKNNILYNEEVLASTITKIESSSTPRGRIYDRNGLLLVDNKAVKTIYYKKNRDINYKEEINMAYKIGSIIAIDYSKLKERDLKNFWLLNNKKIADSKISEIEYRLLEERKLTIDDIRKIKFDRVTTEELNTMTNVDKKAAYIYYLMNNGYSHEEKIIKNEAVTDFEYAYIFENSNNLKGFNTKLEWERVYLYGDTLKSVFGRVSTGLPTELKDYYLALNYELNDKVGVSGLEYQYESYLKGNKAIYEVKGNNTYELYKKGSRGNDIYLTIDINLQLEIDNILKEEVLNAKLLPTSIYYDHSFVVITKPKTGEILALSGKQVVNDNGNNVIYDYTSAIINSPVTVGSVIKGASIATGYKYKAIDIGSTFLDQCIKIKNTPEKCSWRSGLGTLNDIDALKWSSNSYQFQTAIKVAEGNYIYNGPLKLDTSAFDKYRTMYHSFGLGIKTGIDLPHESIGYKGTNATSGLLLDFSIGQYDTYTPMQLSQYINTIANKGYRITPHLLKSVSNNNEPIYVYKTNILNKVDLESIYLNRIVEAFTEVMKGPLGKNYLGIIPNTAGKTGTAQSFLDTNYDGNIDTETITNTFVGFYPADNPQISFVIISPDVLAEDTNQSSRINRLIAARVANTTYNRYKY